MTTETHTALSVLDEILCTAAAVGVVLVALLPAARGMSAVGWLPMWLVGMPMLARWALHGFAVPWRPAAMAAGDQRRIAAMRRVQPQARRVSRTARREPARRAA